MRFFTVAVSLACLAVAGSCQSEPKTAPTQAFRATERAQLLGGGPRALGEVGDFVLVNDKIRVVIQDAGFSRGFGVYGGGIIDADIRRPDEQGRELVREAGAHDIFAEMFPSFFFQAVACDKVEVLTDGTNSYDHQYGRKRVHYDEGVAVVRASGGGGEFLTMLKVFDSIFLSYLLPTKSHSTDGMYELLRLGVLLAYDFDTFQAEISRLSNENARYEIDYVLRPGAKDVEIRSRIINVTSDPLTIPSSLLKNPTFQMQLGGVDLSQMRVPIGTVLLYGMLNNVWLPGAGFDLRHPIERAFKRALPIPAFSGVVTEFIASAAKRVTDRVSYGLIADASPNNFVANSADLYRNGGAWKDTWTPIDDTSMLVPFTAISFIGVFADSLVGTIEPREYVEQVQHFIVGDGDVASIVDTIARLRKAPTGTYQGQMRDALTGEKLAEGQILIYQELELSASTFTDEADYLDTGLRLCATRTPDNLCRPYSQDYPDADGNLGGTLPPGRYAYRVQGEGRSLGPWVPFEVRGNERTSIYPTLAPPAYIQAFAADQDGTPVPAKVTVVGQYAEAYGNAQRRSGAVYDIQAGEAYRFTDMLDDRVEGQRAFIEASTATDASGQALLTVRPGDYTVYFSRGPEHALAATVVHVAAGNVAAASGKVARVLDTKGWMSLDAHAHCENSIDSALPIPDRLHAAAGEGLDILISADHNFVSDWQPSLDALGLQRWLRTYVGIEFTTLESGHYNAYPLEYKVGPVTHGAFEWFGRPPADLFAGLRALAPADLDGGNIIVCNHPRDSTQGYFNQYGRSSLTGAPLAPGTSKRLAGVNGPAFFDANGRSTLSYGCDALEIVNGKLGHEIHSVRVPDDWPAACYVPLPEGFDPKKDKDPCARNGKVLRPATQTGALVKGTILTDLTPSAAPGASGIDNLEAVFPGAVDDWFHMLNQGYRHTGVTGSDAHGTVGSEVGWPRSYVNLGIDEPAAVDVKSLVRAVKERHAVTLSNGPFLTFTVAAGRDADGGSPIGAEVNAPGKEVSVNYRLAAAPWVSVSRIQIWVNGRLHAVIPVDPDRDLSDAAGGALTGRETVKLEVDSWIVLEAVGERPMFPVIVATEEPFLLVSDAVGALAGPLGITATTDIAAVVVGNPQPYAITNPIWVKVGASTWQPPGVVPFKEYNTPAQDPHVGVLLTHN